MPQHEETHTKHNYGAIKAHTSLSFSLVIVPLLEGGVISLSLSSRSLSFVVVLSRCICILSVSLVTELLASPEKSRTALSVERDLLLACAGESSLSFSVASLSLCKVPF